MIPTIARKTAIVWSGLLSNRVGFDEQFFPQRRLFYISRSSKMLGWKSDEVWVSNVDDRLHI